MSCPSEDTALSFVRGELHSEMRQLVVAHLNDCEPCYQTLTELARIYGSDLVSLRQETSEDSGVRHLPASPAPEFAMSDRLGRYRIDRLLGEGAMGRVLGAWDEHLQRPVALKLLHRELASAPESERQILEEARALACIDHPHIVAIYDAAQFDKQLYIAMEHIDGENLRSWGRTRRTPQAVYELLVGIMEALADLHDRGIVHRDIKPENILIGRSGRAKLGDFGLAAMAGGGEGVFAGTPVYMSPEQLFARPVDARSDQFSLAVVLYELLGQRRPFQGNSLDALKYHVAQGPMPLAVPGVSVGAAKVIERALQFDPARRFPSLRAFVAALRHEIQAPHRTLLRLHTGFLAAQTLGHALLVYWFATLDSRPTPTSPASSGAIASGGFGDTVIGIFAFGFVVTALISLFWVPVGIVWAPLNAWGIATAKRWARLSTLLYAAMGLLTCVGTPYAIFALLTLTRKDIVKAFEHQDTF